MMNSLEVTYIIGARKLNHDDCCCTFSTLLCMMLVISRNIDTHPLLKLSSKLLGSVERLYDAELLWPIL